MISDVLEDFKSDKNFLESKKGLYTILVKAKQRSQAILGVFDQRAKDTSHKPFLVRELQRGEQISDNIIGAFNSKLYKIDVDKLDNLESLYISLIPTNN